MGIAGSRAAQDGVAAELTHPVLQIGRWFFDARSNTLCCGAETVHVEPKVADLLAFFAAHAGQVVARSALLDAVWPGVVVGDDALTQSVNKLRRALGDNARPPEYLETVPKRGYRLVAAVGVPPPATSAADLPAASHTHPGLRPRHRHAAVALGVALLVCALAAWQWSRGAAERDLAAILALVPDSAGGAAPVPEVLVRRFDAIGPRDTLNRVEHAYWMQVVAGLSRVPGLQVIAGDRDTAGGGADGAAAPHRYQVDGTVQQFGDRLSVHLVLSQAASGRVVWSQPFTVAMAELSSGRHAAVGELLQALTVRLSQSELDRLARPYTASTPAFAQFLLGQAAFGARERQGAHDARAHYLQAIAADPGFARAFAGLALTHAADATFGWVEDRPGAIVQAEAHSRRALALDADQPEIHWVLAWVAAQRREHPAALAHLRRAVELNHSYADAYALASALAAYVGQPEAALALMRNALRLRPGAGFLHQLGLGRALFFLGEDERAIVHLRAALALNPTLLESHVYLAAALQRAGQHDDAAWEMEEARALQPGFRVRPWLASSLLTDGAHSESLAAALDPLERSLTAVGPGGAGAR